MGLDMVFDPDNGNMYIAYVANSGCGSKGNTNYLYVFHTADGTSLSNLSVLLTSSSFISSPSITYSSASKQFVVSSSSEIFTSSDGINWVASQQVVVGSGIISAAYSEIRFINSYYWLSYSDTSNYIHIAQSSDLNTWSLWSNVGTQTYLRPRLSYYPPQSQYHLDWQGTNFCGTSCGGINDMPSSNAQTWGSKNVFQSTQQEPVLAYDPSTQSLLMAWTGTDCCFGGSLNVMQYHNIATSGGGGGGGSVALGTEILTPNGNVAVQNLNVGDTVVSIDPFTQQLYHSTITSINIVTVGNMLIFHTATGQPLRVDINPRLRFNAIHNDQLGLWSTVLLVPGDSLYQFGYGWTTITGIDRIYGGQHTYYDLHLDPLHDYIASGYADCPCKT